jgi:demethylmenaquinone methyltransferase/2-methoxy-6-polyprenyl-1,4-benzoquinol methylase
MGKGTTKNPDMDAYEKCQYLLNLRDPVVHSAIQALQYTPGSRGLDVGCGIGSHTLMLADAVFPDGHVTGLDLSSEQLAYAREAAKESELSSHVSFREGDMRDLPFDDDTFDWVWSMDCVGYAPVEPLPLINELVRVVKPGGRIAILAWSSQQLLPGYPSLESRINSTVAGIAPFVTGKSPEKHFLRAQGWFRDAGLEVLTTQTFVGSTHAPLSDDICAELLALFQMRWPGVESELSQDDWAEFQRLCNPESPDCILDHPDYYAFFTYSMFHGKVAERK